MLIWFVEIPVVFFFIAAIVLFVMGKMAVEFFSGVYITLGVALLVGMIISFLVSVVMQHIDAEKVRKCDIISARLGIQGIILILLGVII